MPKDSQPDNKRVRIEKSNHQTPLTKEGQNDNRTTKKQSVRREDL